MSHRYKKPDKGDPSDIIQFFPKLNIQLLCCRYWWLAHWEFQELSFPYWRVYHNSRPGAVIIHNKQEIELLPNRLIVIAPNTSYATRLFKHSIPKKGYRLKGGRIKSTSLQTAPSSENIVEHLFLHFNIGMPYDHISPGIFQFEVSAHLATKLETIKNHLLNNATEFPFSVALTIQSLIADLLSEFPEETWNFISYNPRILKVLNYIDTHLNGNLSNVKLAECAQMATNAFTRLFAAETGNSPQKYIRTKRIDRACILLHHSAYSIEEIASQTGFSDRYHFSRIFKQVTQTSPAQYRKKFNLHNHKA